MNRFSKTVGALTTAALISVSMAAPADAQRWRGHHRGGGNIGEAIAVVAVLGGAAAIIGAAESDRKRRAQRYESGYDDRYNAQAGYDDRYDTARRDYGDRYGDDEGYAVSSCGDEAARNGRGSVRITRVEHSSSDRYWVQGVIEDGGYDRGGYARDDRYDRNEGGDRYYDSDRREDRYSDRDRGYDRDGRYGGITFTCEARSDGRITNFGFNRY